MFTLDFLVVVLVAWGIMKIVRAINTPTAPKPPVGQQSPRSRIPDPPERGKIVDATFEELE